MSTLGSYEVHQSDHACNEKVKKAIELAKLTKDPRDYIDCLLGVKDIGDIKNYRRTLTCTKYLQIYIYT